MIFGNKSQGTEGEGQFLILPLILSVMASLALILVLVWMNIERTQLSYDLRAQQRKLDQMSEKHAKLTVERESLLSPQWLGRKAEEMGLVPAKPGQVRRMGASDEKQTR